MSMIIDNIDMESLQAEKYWSWPKNYKGDAKAETKNFIMSGNYLAAIKQDGHYFRFIKDMNGFMRLQGRSESVNGGYLDKLDHVPQLQSFFDSLPNGTCLLGEIYFPSMRGSRNVTTIMGCLTDKAIERQNKGEKLHYYIFDVYAWNGKSLLETKFEDRVNKYLNKINTNDNEYVEVAEYYSGEEAWNKLEDCLAAGLEGMVATRRDAKVEPGKRTARKTLKIKMSLADTIDAFYDGKYKPATKLYTGKAPETWSFWLNEKTGEKTSENKYYEFSNGEPWTPITKAYYYGWASAISFSVMRDGKPYHIGYISGITDEVKEGVVENPDKWIGRAAELSAMEVEKTNGQYTLRHGKIITWRADKLDKDCTFDQLC